MLSRNGHIVVWALLSVAAALASCRKQEPVQGGAVPIALEAGLEESTKAASAGTTTLSLQDEGIGLFAWNTPMGSYFDGSHLYLNNTRFSYSSGSYVASAYWLPGSWLSFFGYAPYMANVSSGALVFPSGYENGFPTATYTPASNPAQQVDLCLAAPVLDRTSADGTVPLTLSHALTKVLFRARWTGDAGTVARVADMGYGVRITSITLSNVRGSNTLHYTRDGYYWDSPAASALATYATSSYSLSVANGTLMALNEAEAAIPQTSSWSSSFVPQEGTLYLLPQALASTATLSVTFGFYKSGSSLAETFSTAVFNLGNLPQYVWPMGKVVTYSITLDLTPGGYPTIAGSFSDLNAGGYKDGDSGLACAGSYQNGPALPDVRQ